MESSDLQRKTSRQMPINKCAVANKAPKEGRQRIAWASENLSLSY